MIKQTPWFERKFDFSFPVGYFPAILERLRSTRSLLDWLTMHADAERLVLKPNGDWSIKEQIGHLADLEDLWFGRVEDILAGEKRLRTADLSNARTHGANHNSKNISDLIIEFSISRNKLIEKIKDIDEEMASRTAIHPRLKMPMRLVDSLFFVAEHDAHHLAKIRELLD